MQTVDVRFWPDRDRVEPRGFSLVFADDLSKAGRETQLTDAGKSALQCPEPSPTTLILTSLPPLLTSRGVREIVLNVMYPY